MKVLMFGWEFPPHISGGLGTACYGLTRGLSTIDDVELIFVVPKAYGDECQKNLKLIAAGDVTITDRMVSLKELKKSLDYIEVESKLIPYTDPEDFWKQTSVSGEKRNTLVKTDCQGRIKFSGKYGADLFEEISNYALTANLIAQDNEFDIIHAHDWLTYPAGIAAKQASGKPLVIHVHATDFDRSGGEVNPNVFAIERKGMEAADKIITVSNLTRKIVIEKYGISPEKVVTVYNAVEPIQQKKEFKFKKGFNEKIVTFLGRITMQKGPEYFVEAANKILQKMDNVRFVMAGSGDMMNKMIKRAAELGITNKFHFTGFLKGDEVFEMLNMSDVYVMPSVSEPFGISPLEAMQSNVPVIISHQSGVAEILTHAKKIDFWDVDAMADAIYGIISYPALSKMFIKHGGNEADSLKWEDSANNVRSIYKTAMIA
ncbi:MAG: glycosyltransferase [Bacteroidetes bacterium]|nr:glycosyltransferase [Bacteroidota bacterium]